MEIFDCAVIGGGPAGINASLVLGRARRKVILFDNGTNRNRVTQKMNGFLTRDGTPPAEFRNMAMQELYKYPSVKLVKITVIQVVRQGLTDLFQILTAERETYWAERVLLATGIQEVFPAVPAIRDYYGKCLFSCPYCDGWELRDQPLLILIENGDAAHQMAKLVYNWSTNLLVATNGQDMSQPKQGELEKRNIVVVKEPIRRLQGKDGYLEQVEFASGLTLKRMGGFVKPTYYRANHFAEQLGCQFRNDGMIVADYGGRTTQKNVYTAGEVMQGDGSTVVVSAAEGSRAAFAINKDITYERF